jgi:hypothetical protein
LPIFACSDKGHHSSPFRGHLFRLLNRSGRALALTQYYTFRSGCPCARWVGARQGPQWIDWIQSESSLTRAIIAGCTRHHPTLSLQHRARQWLTSGPDSSSFGSNSVLSNFPLSILELGSPPLVRPFSGISPILTKVALSPFGL